MTNKKGLFGLAIPLLLNSILGLMTTFIDAMIISHHAETTAAAVSLANQILVPAYDFSFMLAVGATIFITHALGDKKVDDARSVAVLAILANTVVGALLGLLLYLAAPILITLVNVPEELVSSTRTYINIVAIALPFNGFMMAAVATLRGFSLTRQIFYFGLIAFPSYIILDYILVLGWWFVPSLGVEGSALATLLVRVGSVIFLLILLPKLTKLKWSQLSLTIKSIKKTISLFKISSPSVLDNVAYGFYQLVLLSFIAGMGIVGILARFYTLSLSAFLAVIVMAISQANEVLVGYQHGAKSYSQLSTRVWSSVLVSVSLATLMAVVMYLMSNPLVSLFTDDPNVHTQAKYLLLLTIFIQPLTGLNTVLFHSLRVIGDVVKPVIFSQIVMWGVAIPVAWSLIHFASLGVEAIWYAMIVEELLKTIYIVYRWRMQSRRLMMAN
ncbi:MAG: MATE family efflux transporter [Pseudomonadota bacterium]